MGRWAWRTREDPSLLKVADLFADEEGEQGVEEAVAAGGTGDAHVGDEVDVFVGEGLRELHDGVVRAAKRLEAGAVGFGLGVAGGADGVGFAEGAEFGGLGCTASGTDCGLRVEFGDAHALVGVDDLLLDVGEGGGLHEFLALALGGFLRLVGFLFLFGDLAVGLRVHELGGGA